MFNTKKGVFLIILCGSVLIIYINIINYEQTKVENILLNLKRATVKNAIHIQETINNLCSELQRPATNISTTNTTKKIHLVPETACSSPHLSINDGGRLGNNICEYMTLLMFRKTFGIRVVTTKKMKKELSKLFVRISTPSTATPCFKKNKTSYLQGGFKKMYDALLDIQEHTNDFTRTSRNSSLKQENFITGYPCPIERFFKYKEDFITELTIKRSIQEEAKNILIKTIFENNYNISKATLISVHVRRTDYINYSKKHKLTMPTEQFYKKAIRYFEDRIPNAVFIVITDDRKWVKKKLSAKNVLFSGTSAIKNPYVDFTIMTLCDHHIVGMGTFGKTSAFLGGGITLTYATDKKEKFALNEAELGCKV